MRKKSAFFGVDELGVADELRPRWYSQVFDLTQEGLPWLPTLGRVTFRRYDPPSPWHVHKGCLEIIYCVSGVCEYLSCGKRYSLRPGQMFVSRPDEPHRQLSHSVGYSTRNILFRISGRLEKNLKWVTGALCGLPRSFGVGLGLMAKYNRIFELLEDKEQPRMERRYRLKVYVEDLLLDIIDAANRPTKETMPLQIKSVADEMERHPERDYPIEALVKRLGMSPASLFSGFKSVTGFSPHAYLTNCRVERAKADLLAGKPVKEISADLRFPSPQHFSATFKKMTGQTPRAWLRLKST